MAVDQEDAERLADRHDQPALVVQGEGVVIDRNLDQMIAGRGELLAEDGRDVFARRQIERSPRGRGGRRPSAAPARRRRGRAEIVQDRANQDGRTRPSRRELPA